MSTGHRCVNRRTVLGAAAAGAAAVGLSGCGGAEWYPAEVTPDAYVVRAVLREKERMVTRYETAIAGGAEPAELLGRLLEHHLTHADALAEALPDDADPSPEAAPDASAVEGPALDTPLTAADLLVLESSATAARLDQAAAVTDAGLAQLICGIGACEAGHAHLLDEER
ncbi:ferritin-like protein [Nocardiopsis sp. Huas11]|uniref:ferritin-like domain-containing protein n=1 Tax=Nocardiopsis sp. Huas11 TaxID=2183912 RepID=UPI000EB0AB91|nr:ferritin-like domain-containing protein [Nocardiopsis sp. Huas11]RKS05176.1 ferritin-like protein [Nocardiopsis sp. Huas11]